MELQPIGPRGGWQMFGFGSTKEQLAAQQQAYIAQELSAIREGVSAVRTDVATLGQDLKGVRQEQGRHEDWLRRIDGEVHHLRRIADKMEDLERRVGSAEGKIGDLANWKTVEGAKWTGPQKVLATVMAVGSLFPMTIAALALASRFGI